MKNTIKKKTPLTFLNLFFAVALGFFECTSSYRKEQKGISKLKSLSYPTLTDYPTQSNMPEILIT